LVFLFHQREREKIQKNWSCWPFNPHLCLAFTACETNICPKIRMEL
jgi:hypothetical protein